MTSKYGEPIPLSEKNKKISESLKKHFQGDGGISHRIAISQAKIEYWKKIKGEVK